MNGLRTTLYALCVATVGCASPKESLQEIDMLISAPPQESIEHRYERLDDARSIYNIIDVEDLSPVEQISYWSAGRRISRMHQDNSARQHAQTMAGLERLSQSAEQLHETLQRLNEILNDPSTAPVNTQTR